MAEKTVFPKASNTATMTIFRRHVVGERYEVLLVKRKETSSAYPGYWSLPGGFLNPGLENMEQCATRETEEETGLEIPPENWILTGVSSDVETDPRDHVVNICYGVKISYGMGELAMASDDAVDSQWVEMWQAESMDLAFDHSNIIRRAIGVMGTHYEDFIDHYSGFE